MNREPPPLDELLDLYNQMYYVRRVEEEIRKRYPEGKMRCPVHLSIGQESPAVGVIAAMNEQDHVFSHHRAHAHYLAKGGNLERFAAELYGLPTGCTQGIGGSMYLSDKESGFIGSFAVVGDCISVGVGDALSGLLDHNDRTTAVFFGDAAVETGQFWEAVNFICLKKLPILLVCENNFYATQSHLSERQPSLSVLERLEGFRSYMWSTQVDDDDVQVVKACASIALKNLPAFMEIRTYRHYEHVGPNRDDDMGYRSHDEVEAAIDCDPLKQLGGKIIERDNIRSLKRIWAKQNQFVRETFDKVEAQC